MDIKSPPNRGRAKGGRSRSPMGAALGDNYDYGNPYDHQRPNSKGRKAKKEKKGKKGALDDDGLDQLEVPQFGRQKNTLGRH